MKTIKTILLIITILFLTQLAVNKFQEGIDKQIEVQPEPQVDYNEEDLTYEYLSSLDEKELTTQYCGDALSLYEKMYGVDLHKPNEHCMVTAYNLLSALHISEEEPTLNELICFINTITPEGRNTDC